MTTIDLAFTVTVTEPVPVDHAYPLYAAVTTHLPALHGAEGWGLHPLRGRQIGDRQLKLMPWSRLTIRTSADRIPDLLPLAGAELRVGPTAVCLGVPSIHPLQPAPALRSRLVTIKLRDDVLNQQTFTAGIHRQLEELQLSPGVAITVGRHRTFGIKGREIIGFQVIAENLSPIDSLILQEIGIGGRRALGCGIFVPVKLVKTAGGAT